MSDMTRSYRNIKLFYYLNFVIDFNVLAPVAVIYYSMVGGSYAAGMAVFSVVMLSSALFEVPTGMLSDRIGRKQMLISGSVAALVATALLLVGPSYPILIISAILFGLARAFHSGNNDALLYDSLLENNQIERYPELLGKTASMYQLALAISAILGGILASVSYSLLLWIAVIPAVIQLVISFLFVEPSRFRGENRDNPYAQLKEALNLFLHNPRLRLLSIAAIIGHSFSEACFQFFSSFVFQVWPIWAIGFSRFLSNAGAFVSFYLSGRLIKRFGNFPLLMAGNIYARVTSTFAVLFPTVLSPLLYSSTSLFYGVNEVSKNHLFQEQFSDKQRATMGSLQSLSSSIAFACISILLGWLADATSVAWSLIFAQICLTSIIFIYWKLFKNGNTKINTADSIITA